jgi:hypothetical protein
MKAVPHDMLVTASKPEDRSTECGTVQDRNTCHSPIQVPMLHFMAHQAKYIIFCIRPINVLTENQTHSYIMIIYHTHTGHYNL